MPPRKRLGQLLTELKVIDEAQLQSALGHQKQWGGKIGAIVVEKGFCTESQLVNVLSQHLGIPTVKLVGSQIDPRAVKTVSRSVAERLHVFAYEVVGAGRSEVVSVAMSDPTDLSAVDQLAFHTGKRIKAMLAADSEILAAIDQHYPESSKPPGRGTGPNLRPVPGPAARPPPLHVAPPVATPVESPRKIESPRSMPYIPPPVPHDARRATPDLEEIEPELPSATEGSPLGFEAEQERLRKLFPKTDAIEPPPESEEPMSLETPTNLQGWSEGPRPAGIEWAGSATEAPSGEAQKSPAPTSDEAASTTEPQPAPSEWHVEEQRQAVQEAPAEWQAAPPEEAPAEWAETEEAPAAEEAAPAEWQVEAEPSVEAERTEPSGEAPAEWQTAEEAGQGSEAAPAEWQAGSESGEPAAEAPAEWRTEAEQTEPTGAGEERWAAQEAPPEETAPAEWARAEGVDHAGEWAAQGGETAEVPETSADFGSPQPLSGAQAEWSAQEPRVAGSEASTAEVPQDAWEDEPVEDATEAPAEWTESESGEVSAAEPAEPVALPGPGEAVAEEAGPAAGTEVPAAYEEAESTDRFQRPLATPPFGSAAAASEPAPAPGEDQTDEWPQAAEAPQEDVAWLSPAESLSAADVATLSALGIDPGDETGAIRALVCLVRVLNRRQAIDVEELAAEIRESRAASAAEVATPEGNPEAEATGAIASPRE
jgi:Type II secretion system (T2SS), protein E, N-terminal domain